MVLQCVLLCLLRLLLAGQFSQFKYFCTIATDNESKRRMFFIFHVSLELPFAVRAARSNTKLCWNTESVEVKFIYHKNECVKSARTQ